MRLAPLDVDDEADAAGVVLVAGIVEALCVHDGAYPRGHGYVTRLHVHRRRSRKYNRLYPTHNGYRSNNCEVVEFELASSSYYR